MSPLDALELDRLLGGLESDRVERKASAAAAIVVGPSRIPPVLYHGRVWVRVGPTVRQATPEEEQRPSERRRARERPFDQRLADGATGGHAVAVQGCYRDFRALAMTVAERAGIEVELL